MPTIQPSDRTPAKGGHPAFNPGLSAGDAPQPKRREMNPICPHYHMPHTKNAKRTQLPPGKHAKYVKRTQFHPPSWCLMPLFRKTNPIFPHSHPAPHQICETNPIPGRAQSRRAEMPQLRKTNPICPSHVSLRMPPLKEHICWCPKCDKTAFFIA